MGSVNYFLYTRVDICFAVHKLVNSSSNPGKFHFEGSVHLLMYIRYNKSFGLRYFFKVEDSPLTALLRQARIIDKNLCMVLSDSSSNDCPDTVRSTGSYILFYQAVSK